MPHKPAESCEHSGASHVTNNFHHASASDDIPPARVDSVNQLDIFELAWLSLTHATVVATLVSTHQPRESCNCQHRIVVDGPSLTLVQNGKGLSSVSGVREVQR